MTERLGRRGVLALLAGTLAQRAGAADSPVPAPALSSELLKTGLYLISGGGANTLVRLSAVGAIVVNGKLPGQYRPLMSQVRRISRLSDLPVRVLIVTDAQSQHAANAALFAAAGVAVLVQDGARSVLPALTAPAASSAKPPAPVVGFGPQYRLRMGGVEADLQHMGAGHSGSDTVVRFPDLKVLAVGDLVTPGPTLPDYASGGSLAGWRRALEQLPALEFDTVVPSSGPALGREALPAFQTRLQDFIVRAGQHVRQGASREQLAALLQGGEFGWTFNQGESMLAALHAELAALR